MSAPRVPRGPWYLLGAMTLFSFGGPVVIGAVLAGGPSPKWPPDRAVEWATLVGISGIVLALMLACLVLSLVNHRAIARPAESTTTREDRP